MTIIQAGKSFSSVNSKSRTGGHTVGDKVLDTHTELPKLMLDQIKEVSEKSKMLLSRIQLLRESFKNKNVEKIMAAFGEIEKNLEKFESEIENVENVMHLQLKNCFVAFDIDPHLIDKLSDRKLSQSAYDRYEKKHSLHSFAFNILLQFLIFSKKN